VIHKIDRIIVHPKKSDSKDHLSAAGDRPAQGRVRSRDVETLLVWDKGFGPGATDQLAGFVSLTSNLVVSLYFTKD
jgi:hypothetical protein